MPRHTKLKHAQIRAAYCLYRRGTPLRTISEQIWARYGFASPDSCLFSLRQGMRIHGFKVLTVSESNALKNRVERCSRCGIDASQRTRGCETCSHRHSARARRGVSYRPGWESCRACGCPMDEHTPGCGTCKARHWKRAKKRPAR